MTHLHQFRGRFLLSAMVAALCLGFPAHAERTSDPEQPPHARSALTKSEVQADLLVWRLSGLSDYDGDQTQSSAPSPDYLAAKARYEEMRASPKFAELVAQIAERRGEPQPKLLAAEGRNR